MANTRAHVAISLDPHARGFVGSGRGGGRVGTGEKESRRTEEEEEEEGRVYKEQEEEGRNEGRGNGEGGRLDGVKKNEVHGRNALRGEREGGKREEGKTGRRREKGGGEETWNKGKFRVWRQCALCVRVMSKRGGGKGKGREEGDLSCGSICEHVTHMERPLYA